MSSFTMRFGVQAALALKFARSQAVPTSRFASARVKQYNAAPYTCVFSSGSTSRTPQRIPTTSFCRCLCSTLSPGISERIRSDLKSCMKASRDKSLSEAEREEAKLRVVVIKSVMAGIKNADIAAVTKTGETDPDETAVAVLQNHIKKANQAIDEFVAADRSDMADKEREEITILQGYLPVQLDAAALDIIAAEIVAKLGITSPKEMGKAIGMMKQQVGTAADGTSVAAAVKRAL